MGDKYIIEDGRLPTGGPLREEYYGSMYILRRDDDVNSYTVLVPDPGDGSKEPLAQNILKMLNEEGQ